MSLAVFTLAALFTLFCMRATQRLAVARGKRPVLWMVAAATLGPLPLIPLALQRKP